MSVVIYNLTHRPLTHEQPLINVYNLTMRAVEDYSSQRRGGGGGNAPLCDIAASGDIVISGLGLGRAVLDRWINHPENAWKAG